MTILKVFKNIMEKRYSIAVFQQEGNVLIMKLEKGYGQERRGAKLCLV